MHVNLGVLEIKWLRITARAVKIFFYRGPWHTVSNGARRLISANLVVLDMKGFGNNLSCNWLEIGKGRNKLVVCTYHREFKVLGVDGSNSFTEKCTRFEEFLKVTNKTRNSQNVVILGDFNVNLLKYAIDNNIKKLY